MLLGPADQRTRHCAKQATINQVATMLATSENVIFPPANHLLTTNTDDPSLAGRETKSDGS